MGQKSTLKYTGSSSKWDKYKEVQAECLDLAMRKNADYGNDAISGVGVLGISVRLWDKVCRLKSLVVENKEITIKEESIRDIFKDILNYATFALIIMDDPKIWYKD